MVKNLPTNAEDTGDVGLTPGLGKIPWRRKWQPTLVLLPGESHGQSSLEGYSLCGHKESDTTEVTEHARTNSATRARAHTHTHTHRIRRVIISLLFYFLS